MGVVEDIHGQVKTMNTIYAEAYKAGKKEVARGVIRKVLRGDTQTLLAEMESILNERYESGCDIQAMS